MPADALMIYIAYAYRYPAPPYVCVCVCVCACVCAYATIHPSIWIHQIVFVGQTMMTFCIDRDSAAPKLAMLWGIRAGYIVLFFFFWLLLRFRNTDEISGRVSAKYLIFMLNILVVSSLFLVMVQPVWGYWYDGDTNKPLWTAADSYELFLFLIMLHNTSCLLFRQIVVVDAIITVSACLAIVLVTDIHARVALEAIMAVPLFTILSLVSVYVREYVERHNFVMRQDLQSREKKCSEVLTDMLPKHVHEDCMNGALKLAYNHVKMTFAFADIVGFTSYAKTVDAPQVVYLLQTLFNKFDQATDQHEVYKLCTIGDAYVAMTEPSDPLLSRQSPIEGARSILAFANSMLDRIHDAAETLKVAGLSMRIGLHFGECVGGCIGSGRLRYDIWGMDVLKASHVEQAGKPGAICVSGELKSLFESHMKGAFEFTLRSTETVINEQLHVYLIEPAAASTQRSEPANDRTHSPRDSERQKEPEQRRRRFLESEARRALRGLGTF
eukprot:GHVU01038955.1.p1 GENE.GHVU01038955.1~~GHVU01038955.1.p1  ORF type:complete len:545 (+),score=83.15 GHVU01038955.1:145-1635(+)